LSQSKSQASDDVASVGPESPVDPNERAEQRPVWAWIDRSALRHNCRRAVTLADGRDVIGVVKADAYGHGAEVVAHTMLASGVKRLAVVSIGEGATLRNAGMTAPILLLGGIQSHAAAIHSSQHNLTPVIHDEQGLLLAGRSRDSEAKRAVEVEIEVDTGMRRMGVLEDEAAGLIEKVMAAPGVRLSGVYTHLARADEADPEPSRAQCLALAKAIRGLPESGAGRPAIHVANSGGLFRLNEFESGQIETDAVRPGLMLYGLSPFADRSAAELDLLPVMTLEAQVIATRRVSAGTAVGYGGEWVAPVDTTIATLPLGYADGMPRALKGRGEIFLAGEMRPIVGRISMDSLCLDVGDAAVEVGDLATVFGLTPGGERVPVEKFAEGAGTIGYEILVGIGQRVQRRTTDGSPPESARK
jgi:alanine racemase